MRDQSQVSKTTCVEASKVCKFICPHLNCGHRFYSKRGAQIHAGKCPWKDEFEVEKILDSKGPICRRRFLIHWKGYSSDFDTWEPRGSLHPAKIEEYEKQNDCYDYEWRHRCPICDLPYSSTHAVKIHVGRDHKARKPQDFSHRLADKAVQKEKLKLQQADRPKVECEGEELTNVFDFIYLGSVLAVDGNQDDDIKRRKAMATAKCGQLRHIFDSENLSLHLKLR